MPLAGPSTTACTPATQKVYSAPLFDGLPRRVISPDSSRTRHLEKKKSERCRRLATFSIFRQSVPSMLLLGPFARCCTDLLARSRYIPRSVIFIIQQQGPAAYFRLLLDTARTLSMCLVNTESCRLNRLTSSRHPNSNQTPLVTRPSEKYIQLSEKGSLWVRKMRRGGDVRPNSKCPTSIWDALSGINLILHVTSSLKLS